MCVTFLQTQNLDCHFNTVLILQGRDFLGQRKKKYLQAGVAAKVKESLDHLQVALVDGYVQWRLPPLVSGIQVCSTPLQHLDDGALITKCCVVHGPVSVFVLNNNAWDVKTGRNPTRWPCE